MSNTPNTDSTLRQDRNDIIASIANDTYEQLKNDAPYINMKFEELGAVCRDIATKELDDYIAFKVQEAEDSKNNAYWERNQLVANLARQYESHMVRHAESDKKWDDDWRWIVCVHTPQGQMTWHIKDSDKWSFDCLVEPDAEHWDGHTTEEKYERLAALNKIKGEIE